MTREEYERLPDDTMVSVAKSVLDAKDAEIERLQDKVDGLDEDLMSALEMLWKRGDDQAREWVKANYPGPFKWR